MRKLLFLIAAISFQLTSALAFAGALSNRAEDVAKRLTSIEGKLSRNEIRLVGSSLRQIEDVIGTGPSDGSDPGLTCISNGQFGGFEKWAVHDLESNRTIGGFTEKANCERSINAQKNSFVCVSNGEFGGFEKFKVYDLENSRILGGETEFGSCVKLVERSTSNLICVSNGELGGFEKFSLVNRNAGQAIGGETDLNSCLTSIR